MDVFNCTSFELTLQSILLDKHLPTDTLDRTSDIHNTPPITHQTIPSPHVFVSLMQLFNLWPCGAMNFIIYRLVTVIFPEILPHATFGDPIQRKKGIVGFTPNYPFFLGIWSERKDSNLRLPAPKKSTLFIIITDT